MGATFGPARAAVAARTAQKVPSLAHTAGALGAGFAREAPGASPAGGGAPAEGGEVFWVATSLYT